MARPTPLRTAALLATAVSGIAALAGLFWTPPGEMPPVPDLYGEGLYRRDTPFIAGGAHGADLVTLLLVLPAGLWAIAGPLDRSRLILLAVALSWLLYLGVSLSFGAVAFNEAFPLYILMMPLSALGLSLVLQAVDLATVPPRLSAFLLFCGLGTLAVWSLLLWFEMAAGAYPPAGYYTSRTTYALDLSVIAPACIAAALGTRQGQPWGMALAVPMLAIAALLLPMMVAQTVMQLRADVALGPEAAAPLFGFAMLSAGAAYFLWRLARPRLDTGHGSDPPAP
jgi:hypothetical protein